MTGPYSRWRADRRFLFNIIILHRQLASTARIDSTHRQLASAAHRHASPASTSTCWLQSSTQHQSTHTTRRPSHCQITTGLTKHWLTVYQHTTPTCIDVARIDQRLSAHRQSITSIHQHMLAATISDQSSSLASNTSVNTTDIHHLGGRYKCLEITIKQHQIVASGNQRYQTCT